MRHIHSVLLLLVLVIAPSQLLVAAVDMPMDIVYTWVDGQDENWQKERQKWMIEEKLIARDSVTPSRFRDRGELRYSLRSIYQFAPFVRKIFLVTNGQVPKWLKEHPKVQVVTHKEIFANSQFLPTFNSMAIECHLHRIPGLSEHYAYFNDDVFLGRSVSQKDFFTDEGKIRVFFSKREIPLGLPTQEDTAYQAACKNLNLLFNGLYKHETRYQHCHTPFPQIKSVVEKIEMQFAHVFQLVSSHRFRSANDIPITNGVIPHEALEMGKAKKSTARHATMSYGRFPEYDKEQIEDILDERPTFFCVQDASNEVSEEHVKLLTSFFERYYPKAAPWEKSKAEEMQTK